MDKKDWRWMSEPYGAPTHWDYYQETFSWGCSETYAQFLDECRNAFADGGFSYSEAATLVDSGFIVVAGNVIDRFYGGLLYSIDSRSRVPLKSFGKECALLKREVRVHHASNVDDLRRCVDEWQKGSGRQLLFRGQTASFRTQRPYQNPAYIIGPYGEVSLLPSLWRKAQTVRPLPRQHFRNLHDYEWGRVLKSSFDMADVEARLAKARSDGNWIVSAQDLEDLDDPVLSKLGTLQLDLQYGANSYLATGLSTLLQHYGLLSPVLDLTSDLDVALFFATHRYTSSANGGSGSGYDAVGTNARKSVIYVIRENATEMRAHEHHRILADLAPLRPIRQSCSVCQTGPDAMNLAGEFLVGIVALDFDEPPIAKYDTQTLFPGPNEDKFLSALIQTLMKPQQVTVF